jgi:hypothetical protein
LETLWAGISLDVGQHPVKAIHVQLEDYGQRDCHSEQTEQLDRIEAWRNEQRGRSVGCGIKAWHRYLLRTALMSSSRRASPGDVIAVTEKLENSRGRFESGKKTKKGRCARSRFWNIVYQHE